MFFWFQKNLQFLRYTAPSFNCAEWHWVEVHQKDAIRVHRCCFQCPHHMHPYPQWLRKILLSPRFINIPKPQVHQHSCLFHGGGPFQFWFLAIGVTFLQPHFVKMIRAPTCCLKIYTKITSHAVTYTRSTWRHPSVIFVQPKRWTS